MLRTALQALLKDDYLSYVQHIKSSGCGAIENRGSFLLMDVSQLHVHSQNVRTLDPTLDSLRPYSFGEPPAAERLRRLAWFSHSET